MVGRALGREEHVAVRAAALLGGLDPDRVEALLDGAGALVGGEDALARRDEALVRCLFDQRGVLVMALGGGGAARVWPAAVAAGLDLTLIWAARGRSPAPLVARTRASSAEMQGAILRSERGRSPVGRASASQAEGRGFEPRRPLQRRPRSGGVFSFRTAGGRVFNRGWTGSLSIPGSLRRWSRAHTRAATQRFPTRSSRETARTAPGRPIPEAPLGGTRPP